MEHTGFAPDPDMTLYRMPADGKLPVSISMGDSQGAAVPKISYLSG
ncbi:MAG: hypothetical protein QOD95_483 [Gammaproteobacteria bacterium]|nr:hypothetical protein [Gammaproteobacteria bacterium]